MAKTKTVIPEIPTKDFQQAYIDKSIQDAKPPDRNAVEFENALDELQNLYPEGTEGLECRIYRIQENNVNAFAKKIDYFPDETYVQENFGPGRYKLFCYVFLDGKRKFLKSPVITVLDLQGNKATPQQQETKQENKPVDSVLDQLKAFREAGLIPSNGNNGNGSDALITMLTTLLTESQKANQAILLQLANQKPAGSNNDKIMEVLLLKALDKTDPFKEIDSLIKIKDALASENNGGGSDDVFSNLIKLAPAFMNMAAAEKNQPGSPVPVKNPGAPQLPASGRPQPKQIPANMIDLEKLEKYIDARARKIAKEIIDQEFPPEDENSDLQHDDNLPEDERNPAENDINNDGGMELLDHNQQNSKTNKSIQMNIVEKALMEKIKNADEPTKINVLKSYLGTFPIEEVKDFCIKNQLVKDETEFFELAKKAGYNAETTTEN